LEWKTSPSKSNPSAHARVFEGPSCMHLSLSSVNAPLTEKNKRRRPWNLYTSNNVNAKYLVLLARSQGPPSVASLFPPHQPPRDKRGGGQRAIADRLL
jgi:hypothetical protein